MVKPLKEMIVEKAIDLISDPNRWTKHVLARSACDEECPPSAPRALRWCAQGAMLKVASEMAGVCVIKVDEICREMYPLTPEKARKATNVITGIVWVNDIQGQEAALEIMRLYLARLRGDAA